MFSSIPFMTCINVTLFFTLSWQFSCWSLLWWAEPSLTFGDLPLGSCFFPLLSHPPKKQESSDPSLNLLSDQSFWNLRNCMWMPEIWSLQGKYLLQDLCYTHTMNEADRSCDGVAHCYMLWKTGHLKISQNLSQTVDINLVCLKFPSVNYLFHNLSLLNRAFVQINGFVFVRYINATGRIAIVMLPRERIIIS